MGPAGPQGPAGVVDAAALERAVQVRVAAAMAPLEDRAHCRDVVTTLKLVEAVRASAWWPGLPLAKIDGRLVDNLELDRADALRCVRMVMGPGSFVSVY
ncbi:MAG: hypothetical protein KC613_04580 [Myxococcales bacterium]|nr:hypothetical protein [Myxococcales bacterium]MCB9525799.1 hypothetical protein [Myxococcales bacterium]